MFLKILDFIEEPNLWILIPNLASCFGRLVFELYWVLNSNWWIFEELPIIIDVLFIWVNYTLSPVVCPKNTESPCSFIYNT